MNGLRIKELEEKIRKLEKKCCCGSHPSGPYADDAAAEAAGISIGQTYYQADGHVVVRLV